MAYSSRILVFLLLPWAHRCVAEDREGAVLKLLHGFPGWSEKEENVREAIPLMMQHWRGRYDKLEFFLLQAWTGGRAPIIEGAPSPKLPHDTPPPRPPPGTLVSEQLVGNYKYRLQNGTEAAVRGGIRLGATARAAAGAVLDAMCRESPFLDMCITPDVREVTLGHVATQLDHEQLRLCYALFREAELFLAAEGIFSFAIEGHTANYIRKLRLIRAVAALPGVRTVCEVGFNAGHSSLAWLSASDDTSVFAFDWARNQGFGIPYTPIAADFVSAAFPGRFLLVAGSSQRTIPAFRKMVLGVSSADEEAEDGGICNVVFVDGGHEEEDAAADLRNTARLVNKSHHVLIMDDTSSYGSAAAWKAATTAVEDSPSAHASSSSSSSSSLLFPSSRPASLWKELWRVQDKYSHCYVQKRNDEFGYVHESGDWKGCSPPTPEWESEIAVGVLRDHESNGLEHAAARLLGELGWSSDGST